MNREKAFNLLEHYVSQRLMTARLVDNEEDIVETKVGLLVDLGTLEQIDEVQRTVKLLENAIWLTGADLDEFQREYRLINPCRERDEVITKLYGEENEKKT